MSAYWITPKGDIMEVDSRHIHTIIEYPQNFGFTAAQIRAIYRRHGERIGMEADAREEIMIRLMERGWIRVRYIPQLYSITLQMSDIFYKKDSWKEPVTKWAHLVGCDMPESASVNIMDLGGGTIWPEQQLYEIASGSLYERRKAGTFAAFLNPKKKKRK